MNRANPAGSVVVESAAPPSSEKSIAAPATPPPWFVDESGPLLDGSGRGSGGARHRDLRRLST